MSPAVSVCIVESQLRADGDKTDSGGGDGGGSAGQPRGGLSLARRGQYVAYQLETQLDDPPSSPAGAATSADPPLDHSISSSTAAPPLLRAAVGSEQAACVRVWRRYSDFVSLRHYLTDRHPYVIMPPLPDKRPAASTAPSGGQDATLSASMSHSSLSSVMSWSDRLFPSDPFDPVFVDNRRLGLELFLRRVGEHKLLAGDAGFISFVQDRREWRDIVSSSGYLKLIGDQLVSWNASLRVNNADKRFHQLLCYAKDVETHVGGWLTCGEQADALRRRYHCGHAQLGAVLSEWAGCEPVALGDALQRAGHHVDAYAVNMPPLLDDEMALVQRLRHYLQCVASLRAMCQRYLVRQHQLEQLQRSVDTLRHDRDDIVEGRQSLVSRLFHAPVTEQQRSAKLTAIDQHLADAERQLTLATAELDEFVNLALADADQFKVQTGAETDQILAEYVQLQMAICKEGARVWDNVAKCMNQLCDDDCKTP